MRFGVGLACVVWLAGCGPCDERCTDVPILGAVEWDEVIVPEVATARLSADQGFSSVRVLGDLDGDGADDLVVVDGARVRVFSGATVAAGDPGMPLLDLPASEGLARVGDVDGDGADDLALGDRAGWAIHTVAGGETPHSTIVPSAGAELAAVAGGGDVDGDGRSDLVVSEYLHNPDDRSEERVYRLDAGPGQHRASAGDFGFGAVVDLQRAHTLEIVGDFDGDGLDDVAAGAARNFVAVHQSAEWGDTGGFLGKLSTREVHLHECYPNPDGCASWTRAWAAGDVDGDGVPDVLAVGVAPASAWVIPGADLALDTYKTGLLGGQLAIRREVVGAVDLVAAGDVDGVTTGDGAPLADLVATDGDSRAWIVLGQQLSGVESLEVVSAAHALEGFAPSGGILVAAGDLTGDGLSDVIVGDGTTLHLLVAGASEVVGYEEVCEVADDRKRCR